MLHSNFHTTSLKSGVYFTFMAYLHLNEKISTVKMSCQVIKVCLKEKYFTLLLFLNVSKNLK